MRKQQEVNLFGNLTAMIDVVFQIIIFFVCTSNMQDSSRDPRIRLASAPHGKPVMEKDPLEITVEVNARGDVAIARTPLSERGLFDIIRKTANEYGPDRVPVIIRGDGRATHAMIRKAMDVCTAAGLSKVKIAALKETGQ